MKQEFSEHTVEQDSYEVIRSTLNSLHTSLPRLVIDLQTLKGTAVKQGALSTPIAYFESGPIDYLTQILILRKYIENLPDTLKSELNEFIPPLCVFLYHELRQRQSKEVYISFLAKIVDLKILPSANEVDNQEYFNTKHVISLSRHTYDHLMDLICQQEWLSILSVTNQKFVFDIKKEPNQKVTESKSKSVLQKACSSLELGLGPSSFSFVKTIKVTSNSTILCMKLTSDNRTLLATSTDSTIYKWELTSSPPSQLSQSKCAPKTSLPAPETGLFYDEHFTVDCGESDRLYVELKGHSGPVYWVAVSKGGVYALSASQDAAVILWNLQTDCMVYKYFGHSKWPVYHVAFSTVSPYFCSASQDTTAKLWRTDHTAPLRIFAGHTAPVTRCEFHPNGSYVVTSSEDMSCRLWDVSSGNCVRVVPLKSYISALAVSPNGRIVACALHSGEVIIWDIATTKILRKYSTENTPQTNGYHSDMAHKLQNKVISHCMFAHENTLVTGDSHGNVMMWDTRLHSKLHTKPVKQISVSGRVKGLSDNKSGLLVVGVF